MVDRCPRCGALGLLRTKKIYGYKYYYFRHSGKVKPTWHYLGKEKPRDNSSETKPGLVAKLKAVFTRFYEG